MATPAARPPGPGGDARVDPTPLLGGASNNAGGSPRGVSRFIRWVSNWWMMSEPAMMVRETAAELLEGLQSNWTNSTPLVFLYLLWKMALVSVSVGVLILNREETPSTPLRLWIVGYVLECELHIICVYTKHRRRHAPEGGVLDQQEVGNRRSTASNSQNEVQDDTSVIDYLEYANIMFSFAWWIIGWYWTCTGGQLLTHDAPHLYWLCVDLLIFDACSFALCGASPYVMGVVVCLFLPFLIAGLYIVRDQNRPLEEAIHQLPRYRFRKTSSSETIDEISGPFGGIMTECGSDPPVEHVLSVEDAACCICLSLYKEGDELRRLACGHHFHRLECIDKWLRINPTCPICRRRWFIQSNNNNNNNSHGREA